MGKKQKKVPKVKISISIGTDTVEDVEEFEEEHDKRNFSHATEDLIKKGLSTVKKTK